RGPQTGHARSGALRPFVGPGTAGQRVLGSPRRSRSDVFGGEETMRRMRRLTVLVVPCVFLVTIGAATPVGAAPTPPAYGYRSVSLDEAMPAGSLFVDYFGLTSSRRAYGNAYTCDETCDSDIVVYRNGTTTVLQHGLGYAVNELGIVGGSVVTDPDAFVEQAALFTDKT